MKISLKKLKAGFTNFKSDLSFSVIPVDKRVNFNPCFLIGCGRSGTTILGKTLSIHPDIKYLNERRDIWQYAYPEFDIWSKNAYQTHKAKLFVNKNDFDQKKSKKLAHLLFKEQALAGKSLLLEKLPINNFRLEFIEKTFPNAKYIYLHRNGLEVAASIEKMMSGGWFGYNDLKMNLLKEFAKDNLIYNKYTEKLSSDFHKGIFEWRLSIDQSDIFFKKLDKAQFISLSYEDFINDSKVAIANILKFLELPADRPLLDQMTTSIKRKNEKLNKLSEFDETTREIGGSILEQSIQNIYFR